MIRVRFFDILNNTTRFEALAKTARLNFATSETPTFEATVSLSQIDLEYMRYNKVGMELFYKGVLMMGGVCQNLPDPQEPTLTIKGRQWIDLLYDEKAYSQAVYKDQPLLLVLGELLRRAGWRIGEIKTMVDPAAVTTLDLRSVNRLLTQVQNVVENTPRTFHRYGGYIVGKHALDIGLFGEESGIQFYRPNEAKPVDGKTAWIDSIKEKFTTTDILRDVEVLGGDVQTGAATTRAINLGDALASNPALATDPDFPILTEIASFVWYIRNNALAANQGARSLERYTQYAPERTGGVATVADIKAAGVALYQRGKALLQSRSTNVLSLDIDAHGTLDAIPEPGDTVFVRASRTIDSFDPYSGQTNSIVRQVEGDFRVNSIDINLSGDEISYSLGVSDGAIKPQDDEFVSVYDLKEEPPPTGAVFAPAFPPQLSVRTGTLSAGSESDTTMSDGTPGKLLTITNHGGSPPVGATGVYLAGIPFGTSPDGPLTVELVSDPAFPGTGTVVRVNINGKWGLSYSATVNARIIWI